MGPALGARSREERYYARHHEPKGFRSPRPIAGGIHRLRLWIVSTDREGVARSARLDDQPAREQLRALRGRLASSPG